MQGNIFCTGKPHHNARGGANDERAVGKGLRKQNVVNVNLVCVIKEPCSSRLMRRGMRIAMGIALVVQPAQVTSRVTRLVGERGCRDHNGARVSRSKCSSGVEITMELGCRDHNAARVSRSQCSSGVEITMELVMHVVLCRAVASLGGGGGSDEAIEPLRTHAGQ